MRPSDNASLSDFLRKDRRGKIFAERPSPSFSAASCARRPSLHACGASARSTGARFQDVNPGVSAVLNISKGRFEIVDSGGQYILKPPIPDYREVPENEDLTMRLAAAAGIEVPVHGMIYTADDSLCYFIRRFDRVGRSGKRAVEDFAQLLGYTRDTKYNASYEQVATVINTHCTFPVVEHLKLLRRIVLAFLCGNEDMHLKNLSLITRDNKIELSPAYDLANTTIVLANPQEEMALRVAGERSKLRRETLLEYYAHERLELTQRSIDGVIEDFVAARPQWNDLLARSFLTAEVRASYQEVLDERWERMGF